MKTHRKGITLILTLLAFLTLRGEATENTVQVLDDATLASVQGGFCIFDKCESSSSGICQPIAPTAAALCATVKCTYTEEMLGNTAVIGCTFFGKTTCANAKDYRQCLQVYFFHICTSSGSTPCGDEIVPACIPEKDEGICLCQKNDTGEPCDWTDCNL